MAFKLRVSKNFPTEDIVTMLFASTLYQLNHCLRAQVFSYKRLLIIRKLLNVFDMVRYLFTTFMRIKKEKWKKPTINDR